MQDLDHTTGNKMLKIGDQTSITKIFTKEEVKQYADLSTDKNPIHIDDNFAKDTVFGQCIVHGMLVASLFSGLLGEKLPGKGTIYLGQNLLFIRPVFIGEEVTVSVEVTKIRKDKPIVTIRTLCKNSIGEIVVDGEAVVKVT